MSNTPDPCTRLPFSICSLLTDSQHKLVDQQSGGAGLTECLPILFGGNLPFGLAQLLSNREEHQSDQEQCLREEQEEMEEATKEPDGNWKQESDEDARCLSADNMQMQQCQQEDHDELRQQQRMTDQSATVCPPATFPLGWLFSSALPAQLRLPFGTGSPMSRISSAAYIPPAFALKSPPVLPFFGGPIGPICGGNPHHPGQSTGSQSQHKRKGGQIRFTNEQTDTLENTFIVRRYLNNQERKKVAKALLLTEKQVKTWFQNRRAKWRRQRPAEFDEASGSMIEGGHRDDTGMEHNRMEHGGPFMRELFAHETD